jgi:hypothetical protein
MRKNRSKRGQKRKERERKNEVEPCKYSRMKEKKLK